MMKFWQQNIINDAVNLEGKLMRLDEFITPTNDAWAKLSEVDKEILDLQRYHMREYLRVLRERMVGYGI